MQPLQERAIELRQRVEEILDRFKRADAAGGPHVDLSCQELRAVEYLGDAGPRMMRELAEHMPVAVNTMTSIVDNLEKKRLLQRQRSEADRRVVRVTLTDLGQAAYRAAIDDKVRLMRTMLGMLTEVEQEIFMVLFRKIAGAERQAA